MTTDNDGIVVLISGRGSNLAAILRSSAGAAVSAVISDNPQAAGLQIAESHSKDCFIVSSADFDSHQEWSEKLLELLQALSPKLIALAGFMRVLPPSIVADFGGRIVNIHPSLLPKFSGLHPHRQALAAGVQKHGCTVHWVSEKVDGGEIIDCREVEVLAGDDEETLAARVLAEEHKLYPQVLADLLQK